MNITDPRYLRSREALRAAARDLLREEGPAAVTHQRVAQRAGVGRATVYRHWAQPEVLLQEVMTEVELPFFEHYEGGDLRTWLRGELRRIADELAIPAVAGAALTLMQSARFDPVTRDHRDRLLGVVTARLAAALDSDGTDPDRPDSAEVAALVLGPLVYRTTMQGRPVSDDLIDRVLSAALPPSPTRRRGRVASSD